MKLFDEYPDLENERILLHRMTAADAPALKKLTDNPRVYRLLPTFLYEQKYEDKAQVIEKMDEECFDTHESILLGIYLKEDPATLVGIAEIYAYEEAKPKASIGYRMDEPFWGRGIGTQVCCLLKEYMMEHTDVRTITGHIMKKNIGSAKSAMKNGFLCLYPDQDEDWGFGEPVTIDKYVYKRRWSAENK